MASTSIATHDRLAIEPWCHDSMGLAREGIFPIAEGLRTETRARGHCSGEMPLRHENQELTLAFEQYREFVRRSLVMHGVESADVDDAMQQVFLVTYRRLDDYRKVDKKVPWLCVVSKLVAQNYRRALRRSRTRALRYLVPPPATLEEILLQRAAARELALVLERLDERDRAVFLHADLEGLSAREIAVELRMNVNTVYTRLRSARQQFALALRVRWLREGGPSRELNPRRCS